MQCHVIVLDTIGTAYTLYEIEKRKEAKKKQEQRGPIEREKEKKRKGCTDEAG